MKPIIGRKGVVIMIKSEIQFMIEEILSESKKFKKILYTVNDTLIVKLEDGSEFGLMIVTK
jgi:hypothetical protein